MKHHDLGRQWSDDEACLANSVLSQASPLHRPCVSSHGDYLVFGHPVLDIVNGLDGSMVRLTQFPHFVNEGQALRNLAGFC